jgi:hypothetical protein
MIFIGMEEDFAAQIAGFYGEATLSIALWVLPVGVINKD